MTPPASRSLSRLNVGLAAAALTALGTLVVEYGFLPTAKTVAALHAIQIACAVVFGLLQACKLLVVERPREYARTHRLDFSILFVLAAQGGIHLALRETPEMAYFASRGLPSPVAAVHVGVLQVYLLGIVALRSHLVHRLLIRMRLRPVQMLVASFALLVAAGTILLALPGASASGRSVGALDAAFTATSAVCVTGLVVRDTGVDFSPLGQIVILVLMQVGGLGILTLTATFALVSGRGIPRGERDALAGTLDATGRDVRRAVSRIVRTTVLIEVAGAGALWLAWSDAIADPMRRASWSLFHAVSAFCNAGFALFPRNASLTAFAEDPVTCAVVGVLIVAGGLGFPVLAALAAWGTAVARRRKPPPLRRHARWSLLLAAGLIAAGTFAFLVVEGERCLAALSPAGRIVAAAFQSITLRTAGFNTVPLGGLAPLAIGVCIALMIIGGGPAGTAGGMKTTTAAAGLLYALRRPGRSPAAGQRAARLGALYLAAYAAAVLLLAWAQGALDARVAFEAASALATVGLTLDFTSELTSAAKLVVCGTMFVGRVGPFALAASIFALDDGLRAPDSDDLLLG